ncbi:sensor histidine kinase [Saccharothrix australiensis]|uniref:histidine kinase n=1 Tax=Saccharothrix australiensis TaxID=2072 RepID=A0A495VYQ4_9PSEU|nr:sensor histidine kinase [Saccharothrix australiensis]RKT53703.1 histidine kinase [Saccharothrix australiensis]
MARVARPGPLVLAVADAVAAVAVLAAAVLRAPQANPAVWVVAAALAVPLAARRLAPAAVLSTTTAAGVVAVVVGIGGEVAALAVAWALYPVGLSSARPGAVGVVGAVACVSAAGLAVASSPALPVFPAAPGTESFDTAPVTALLYGVVVIGGSWAVAAVVRTRRRQDAELAEARTGRAVAEERLRIARDVHDVVGHNLSLIAMKAAVANHVAASHPDERESALRVIERVSRSALDDVRAVLGGLREPAAPAVELGRLVDDARAAGVAVTFDGADLAEVPPAVRVSAYRIVQEALTNVRRHSHPPRCHVAAEVEGDRLVLSIVDEGVATGPVGAPGHGLLGMRERVALHGGSLHTGATPGGGFAVRAALPLDGAAHRAG